MSPRRRTRNPRAPRVPLSLAKGDIATWTGALWRIHTVSGAHPAAWDGLRTRGPIEDNRWDPQPPPVGDHPGIGVSYTAPDPVTCISEVFFDDARIEVSGDRVLSGWYPARALNLLDPASDDWTVRHGATASLTSAPRSGCRAWAAAMAAELAGRIDGLVVPSTITGDPMVVFTGASDSFPPAPAFSRPLDHPDVLAVAVAARARLGWPLG
ncbi:RES family NAD+ phosphorylase [Acidipropionibacterium virtanenii]|uniref:RES domain-containing protein n=1 Tax=Acidipropionibacterium virtanenii TaxID=2057246 RepID=A0A344UWB7_9ACTN|nr:RES family NAD+ phosphorylase [Acidipropionibacterium virtanenii]AXE39565.1 hypothetical protein JS278_02426 [Acidipropionibacterium virtanenii]